jgi:hypothetical protein
MTAVWAGIDSGKRAHHCVVIDSAGRVLLSRRVVNDESALLELIAAVLALAGGEADPPPFATPGRPSVATVAGTRGANDAGRGTALSDT